MVSYSVKFQWDKQKNNIKKIGKELRNMKITYLNNKTEFKD